jgi:small redox-active disulfide protein 2
VDSPSREKGKAVKKVTVYGPGCVKCKKTEELVRQVIAETGASAAVEKVSDVQAIVAAGVMSTPAVAVDGEVKLSGRIPTSDELRQWISG